TEFGARTTPTPPSPPPPTHHKTTGRLIDSYRQCLTCTCTPRTMHNTCPGLLYMAGQVPLGFTIQI
ncbi:hypothetical protein J6590_029953, partial [Homalodisca vitripennis]